MQPNATLADFYSICVVLIMSSRLELAFISAIQFPRSVTRIAKSYIASSEPFFVYVHGFSYPSTNVFLGRPECLSESDVALPLQWDQCVSVPAWRLASCSTNIFTSATISKPRPLLSTRRTGVCALLLRLSSYEVPSYASRTTVGLALCSSSPFRTVYPK